MANEIILVVEDNADLLRNNCEFLTHQGYAVEAAETLAGALRVLRGMAVDLVLLDVNLPDGTGFDLAEKTPPQTAILYLTGRTAEEDVIRGLSRGVGRVDYMRKPFSYAEMAARIKALLAWRQQAASTITRGRLTLDVVAGRAFAEGRDLLLTQKEFALLLTLVRSEDRTLSKERLYESVWRQPLAGDVRALWRQLSTLKKKVDAAAIGVELTAIRGEGYKISICE